MTKPKKKVRRKLRIKKSIAIKKKSDVRSDTLMKMKAQMPRDVAPVFKVKIKRK